MTALCIILSPQCPNICFKNQSFLHQRKIQVVFTCAANAVSEQRLSRAGEKIVEAAVFAWGLKYKPAREVPRQFRTKFQTNPPSRPTIYAWYRSLLRQLACVMGQVQEDQMLHQTTARKAFVRRQRMSIGGAVTALAPKDQGAPVLRNVGNYLLIEMAQNPTRL